MCADVVLRVDSPLPGQDFTKMTVQDSMKLYYGWLFPHDVMYKWLAYGNGTSWEENYVDATPPLEKTCQLIVILFLIEM